MPQDRRTLDVSEYFKWQVALWLTHLVSVMGKVTACVIRDSINRELRGKDVVKKEWQAFPGS